MPVQSYPGRVSRAFSGLFNRLRDACGFDLALSPIDLDLPGARLNWARQECTFQPPRLRVIAGGRLAAARPRIRSTAILRLCPPLSAADPSQVRRAS